MDSSDEIAFPEGDDGLFDDDEEHSSSGPSATVANATAGSSGTSPKGKAAVPTVQVPGSRKVSPTK
jgi:hypothetical protein